MEKKLNLHDLFGVLFPGAIVWTAIISYAVLTGSLRTSVDWSATLALLPIAYVTGLLIQQIASRKFHERRIALALLEPDDYTFSAEFKTNVCRAFEDVFQLPSGPGNHERQMMFDQSYDYVIQQSKGVYVESFYAIYSLCRSMLLVCPIVAILAMSVVMRVPLQTGTRVVFVLLILTVTALALNMFWWAKDRFIKRFAAAVYRSFYSAYRDCRTPCLKGASATPPAADDE